MLFSEPKTARALLDACATTTERYLAAQLRAGAEAIQLFDSWAGILAEREYREFALPWVQRVIEALRPLHVPLIYFALDGRHLFDAIRECGADVLAIDWRTPLDEAARLLGFEQAAGFLRIRGGTNPLDASAVHPESYHIVETMAKDLKCSVSDLMRNEAVRKKVHLENYLTDQAGLPTLHDIMSELSKPGRDPREKFEMFSFAEGINALTDLTIRHETAWHGDQYYQLWGLCGYRRSSGWTGPYKRAR